MKRPFCRQVLDCASPLALFDGHRVSESGRGLPHSRTLARGSWPRCAIRKSTTFALEAFLFCVLFAPAAGAAQRFEFTRMVAHWSDYADPGYLPFIDEAKPEVAQVGFYGAHFWSLAATEHGGGYPANLPVRGHRECADWFGRLNDELHRRGVKVVGHLNVKFLVGDPTSPEGPRGFFKFYRDQWDTERLGPRPKVDALELLEKDAAGTPISAKTYSIGGMREYWGCLN